MYYEEGSLELLQDEAATSAALCCIMVCEGCKSRYSVESCLYEIVRNRCDALQSVLRVAVGDLLRPISCKSCKGVSRPGNQSQTQLRAMIREPGLLRMRTWTGRKTIGQRVNCLDERSEVTAGASQLALPDENGGQSSAAYGISLIYVMGKKIPHLCLGLDVTCGVCGDQSRREFAQPLASPNGRPRTIGLAKLQKAQEVLALRTAARSSCVSCGAIQKIDDYERDFLVLMLVAIMNVALANDLLEDARRREREQRIESMKLLHTELAPECPTELPHDEESKEQGVCRPWMHSEQYRWLRRRLQL